ncbi:MAG: hypothetical protein AAGD05_04670 [Bacteroidota bacterium]
MNQFNWTYLADNGKRHHVGLMHGAQSGHLLVHCNSKIILIDFKVLESATYSIFIDEQLCEITIERKGDQFFYGFAINSKADTPRNRQRKKIEKKHMWQSMAFLGTLLLIILAAVLALTRWNGQENWSSLSAELKKMSQEATARVLIAPADQGNLANYFFIVDGQSYSTEIEFPENQVTILENGMPLEPGDEFIVSYVPNNPRLNKIDYNRPTSKQLDVYHQRAYQKYLDWQPQSDTSFVQCLVKIAYEQHGIDGLADIYFQKASPEENPIHNANSFGRLTRAVPFQKMLEERCKGY